MQRVAALPARENETAAVPGNPNIFAVIPVLPVRIALESPFRQTRLTDSVSCVKPSVSSAFFNNILCSSVFCLNVLTFTLADAVTCDLLPRHMPDAKSPNPL